MSKYSILLCVSAAVLAGCTLTPRYERPELPVESNWSAGAAGSGGGGVHSVDQLDWTTFYQEPRLQRLVELALENNRDLRIAILNVERVRAQHRIQRSALFPEINAGGSMTRQRTPADLSMSGSATTASQFNANVGVTAYELDLFGRVRSLNEQALQTFFATEEARRSAQLALISEVAVQYLNERAVQEQLELARETFNTAMQLRDIMQKRYETGNATQLDLSGVEVQLESARARLAVYEEQAVQFENTLVFLVGGPLPADLPEPRSLSAQGILRQLDAGLPSDLLTRRPDIRAAEHRLMAANANIGAARAAFFPSIRLTASGGTASAELSGLFDDGSGAWMFMPQIQLPIFTGGRNRANLDIARLSAQVEVAEYEKSIQLAFREVSDALASRNWIEQQVDAYRGLVDAQQNRYDFSLKRYEGAIDSYSSVLIAQQDLFSAQQALIQARLSGLTNLVNLYKALGGGWRDSAEPGKLSLSEHSIDRETE